MDVTTLKNAIGNLDEDIAIEMLDDFIKSDPPEEDILGVVTACQQGMEIVGAHYEAGNYYVGDLIFAGELLSKCVRKIKPMLSSDAAESRGTIVLGTVEGDIHDIGKNIFKSLCEAANFHVVDLGVDLTPGAFVQAVQEENPQILGLSGVLAVSVESMKKTIDALTAAGLRDKIKVTIGGNAVSASAFQYTGADAWSKNAAESVRVCGAWVEGKDPFPEEKNK